MAQRIARAPRPAAIAVALLFAASLAAVALGSRAGVASAAAHAHAAKRCFDSASFDGRPVRVRVSCRKPKLVERCYLSSRVGGHDYTQQISCAAQTSAPTSAQGGGSGGGGSGSSGPPSSGSGGGSSSPATVLWSTAVAAVCDDGSTPSTDGEGDFSCTDASSPYCKQQTSALVANPSSEVVCLPYTSIPAAGVCDDASKPGSGGSDGSGAALCADGDYPITPAQAQAGDYSGSADTGTCDDGSDPGDGGFDANGNPLCADGSSPD